MADPKQDYRALARQLAEKYGLDPNIFERQINQESGFNPNAVSNKGASGIGQFMPEHWNQGQFDPFDPVVSLEKSAQLMSSHLANYGGDISKALAAYNAGRGNLSSFGDNLQEMLDYVRPQATKNGPAGERPWAETQRYLDSILGGTNMTMQYTPNATGQAGAGNRGNILAELMKLQNTQRQGQGGVAGQNILPGAAIGGMSTSQPGDLLSRSIALGGGNPFSANPLIRGIMGQAMLYSNLNSLLGGAGMEELLNSGQINNAFSKGAINSLLQSALSSSARGLDTGGLATGRTAPSKLGGAEQAMFSGAMQEGLTPEQARAGMTGGVRGSALDNQMQAAMTQAGGPGGLVNFLLESSPDLLDDLMQMMSWGSAGAYKAMPAYSQNVIRPYWRAFGPELSQDIDKANPYASMLQFITQMMNRAGEPTGARRQ